MFVSFFFFFFFSRLAEAGDRHYFLCVTVLMLSSVYILSIYCMKGLSSGSKDYIKELKLLSV